ncbi:MAG: site-2 protease family protein [Clostridiales bacterium]|nr:site-2 protease family protein [Clostridiales bacterium]MDY6116656.1 site-2 protease family protein [Anaerovoracaceae bacterium]
MNINFDKRTKIFFIIIIAAILLLITGSSSNFINKLLFLPGIIIGITFHEAAHGYVSHWLGDPTPKNQGRLSINPLAHIDPMGFIALLLVGFGWGKPVMIDPRYYKNPKRDELLVSLAGVTTNLIIAIIFAVIQILLIDTGAAYSMGSSWNVVNLIIQYIVFVNLVLMCFNLLPIPPLDGFSVITQLFDLRKYDWYYKLYSNGFFILMALVFIGALDGFLDKSVTFFYYNIMRAVLNII